MNWIQTTLALLQLAPAVLQLIIAVQSIFGAGTGDQKKAVVMATLNDATPAVQQRASALIDAVVPVLKSPGGPIPRQGSAQ